MEPMTQHVPQAGQAQDPTFPDNLCRSQPFAWMSDEILLARLHQALGLIREPRLNDHRSQPEYIGLALILGGLRNLPRDGRTPGKQR